MIAIKLEPANFWKTSVAIAFAATIVSGRFDSTSIAQIPVAHWTFDDGLNNYDTTIAIDSANGNDGVWEAASTAGKTYLPGVIGGAVSLNGQVNNNFVVSAISQINNIAPTPFPPDPPVVGVGVTWMGWFKLNANAADQSGDLYKGILMSRTVSDEIITGARIGQNYGLAWQRQVAPASPLSHLDTRVGSAAVDSPQDSIAVDTWYHAAVVYGNTESMGLDPTKPAHVAYLNGVPVGNRPDTGVFELLASGSWAIGKDPLDNARNFPGLLDDLAVFASALSDAQILAKYNDGLAGIDAAGNHTGILLPADTNGDGVDMNDFHTILNNLGKTVNARNLGDLNGNRKVDLTDFQIWLDSAPAEMQAEALALFFNSVPEPSGIVLWGLALIGVGFGARRLGRV